jgi:2-oxoglutarate ferredoxin oxidoreductase subunit alpha
MDRLKRKFNTAREYMPSPVVETVDGAEIGIITMGSTEPAVQEARYKMEKEGLKTDYMRIRSLPFTDEVRTFVSDHSRLLVVEMNRDGQLHKLLSLEYPDRATNLVSIAYMDGLPLTARFVREAVTAHEEL